MNGVLRALGLCRRAGALVCGTPMISNALPGKKILLVLEAADTSEGTHKKITDKCRYYETEHIRIEADCETLAAAVGKTGSLAAVAVSDANLTELVKKAIESGKPNDKK